MYAAARRVEKMKDLEKKGAKILKLDVTDEKSMFEGVNRVIKEQGRIDVLFNNAGYGQYGTVEETPLDKARYQFDVNVFGLARMTQLVLPHMRKQRSGKIINTSSVGGKVYTPLGAWYHATKHAIEGWSDSLRLELKEFGIDVVIIEPGLIKTEFGDVVEKQLASSTKGPYRKLVNAFIRSAKKSYEKGNASPPSVIAKVVHKAIKKKKPKTRYSAGKMAKPILFFRKRFSDRIFDRIIMSQLK